MIFVCFSIVVDVVNFFVVEFYWVSITLRYMGRLNLRKAPPTRVGGAHARLHQLTLGRGRHT